MTKESSENNPTTLTKKTFSRIFLIIALTIFLIIGLLVVWYAIDIVLLAFAAILLAILLTTSSGWISRKTHLPYILVLLSVIVILIGFLILAFWIAAPFIVSQSKALVEQVSNIYDQLQDKIADYIDWSGLSKEKLTNTFFLTSGKLFNKAGTIFSLTFGFITSFIVFIFVGFYLSLTPDLYVKGFLKAFPPSKREYVAGLLTRITLAMQWWLAGKFISMSIIGLLTYIGLWLLKIPLSFILGLLAGLLTFIPYIGAILAAIPAILIGLAQSPLQAVFVVLLYLLIHAIEGYFISPYVDQKTVSLPPALTIMSQLFLTILLGFIGLALASPLTVVALFFVQEIYARKRIYSSKK